MAWSPVILKALGALICLSEVETNPQSGKGAGDQHEAAAVSRQET